VDDFGDYVMIVLAILKKTKSGFIILIFSVFEDQHFYFFRIC